MRGLKINEISFVSGGRIFVIPINYGEGLNDVGAGGGNEIVVTADRFSSSAVNCATAECRAGLLPAPSENRSASKN